jgi:glucose/arabinose dehydrogenase
MLLLGGCSEGAPKAVATSAPTLPAQSSSVGSSPGAPGSPPAVTGRPPSVTGQTVLVTNLQAPWGLAFLPDGRALITERDTRTIKAIAPDHSVTQVGFIGEADARGEGGLLGIVASPRYADDHTLFLYYTTADDNRIAQWRIGERPRPIVTGIPISGIHNGGRLAFGPDGYLYAGTGDASERGRSQDRRSLGGKILRMTVEGKPAPGNPFGDSLVWSYGHRNVQGLAWDSGRHMWATEFGQNAWDEINRIEPGQNYGWPEVEGAVGDRRFVDPVVAWHPAEAACSGAAVVGQVLVAACLRGQRLWLMPIDGATGKLTGQPVAALREEFGRLRHAALAPDGSVWVLTSNRDNRGNPEGSDDRIIRVNIS